MPIHLTGIEPVATLPTDLSTYVDGYPVYNETDGIIYLARTNQATPAWVEASSAGGGVAFGHPAQDFPINPRTGDQPNLSIGDHPKVDLEYVSSLSGSAAQSIAKDGWNKALSNQTYWYMDAPLYGAGGGTGYQSTKVTLRWYAPVAGQLALDLYKSGTGTCDVTSTLDGVAATQKVNSLAGGTVAFGSNIQTFDIKPGFHSIVMSWVHTGTATASVSPIRFRANVTPTDAVGQGFTFFNDFTGSVVRYDGTEYIPAAHPVGMASSVYGINNEQNFFDPATRIVAMGTPAAALQRNVVGPGSVVFQGTHTATLLGEGASSLPGVTAMLGPAGYELTALGLAAVAAWYATAVGANCRADEESVAVGNFTETGPQCTALGIYASANRYYLLTAPPTPTVTAVAGTSTSYDVAGYFVRGLDTNGLPTTKWSQESNPTTVAANPGSIHQVAWTSGDYPGTTTHIEVVRYSEISTFRAVHTHLGKHPIANGSITDNHSNREPFRFVASLQADDNYAYTFAPSVALGYDSHANRPGSTALGAYTTTTRDHEQKIGKDATTFVNQPGGLVEGHVRAVTAAHTCDSDGNFDRIITANSTTASFSITLPTAPPTGRKITVKRLDGSANTVTVATPGAQTIDGAASHSLTTQWEKVTLIYDGANWLTI